MKTERHCETCTCRVPIRRGLPSSESLRMQSLPAAPGQIKMWYTYEQAGLICLRSPLYIKNLVSQHKLERVLVRGPGPKKTFVVLISVESVQFLRKKLLGV
jgi:hypothetical protein